MVVKSGRPLWRFLVGATVLGGIWAPAAQAQVSTVVRPVVVLLTIPLTIVTLGLSCWW